MLSLCPIVSDSNFYHVIKIVTVRLLHILLNKYCVLAQFDSVTQSCPTPRPHGLQSMPGFRITNSWSLLKLMSIKLVTLPNHLILCCPLLLLPSIFPSIRGFSNESIICIRWPKYWSFSISPSNEYSGLTSFRPTAKSKGESSSIG